MRVFMTGGAGFLGRAILRYYRHEKPDVRFTVYSRDESKHARARSMYPEHNYVLGDVRDLERLETAIAGHDRVIHAAAMKYVPQGESDVHEAIKVNVDGSRNVITAAIRNNVQSVIGISTDKACNPQNVYGMTKRLMERLFQEADFWTDTRFTLVRYGNVVGSTGSVVPIFREQARAGKVMLTDRSMTRFWLSVDGAVDLIDKAFYIGNGYSTRGLIVVPRLPAISMNIVAQACIEYEFIENVEAAKRVEVVETGQRGGEKTHEELVSKIESRNALRHGSITLLQPPNVITPNDEGLFYTSATPDHNLSKVEFMKLIEESQA